MGLGVGNAELITEGQTNETEMAVSVRGLRVSMVDGGRRVVDDVSFDLRPGEILGVVGESGSGKTTLGLALLHHCRNGLEISEGSIIVGGRELRTLGADDFRRLRGRRICYVPQDPAAALNPALRIGTQLAECLGKDRADRKLLFSLLEEVRLPARPDFLNAFPHQL